MTVCPNPFLFMEVSINGNINPCCPSWCNDYTFGNFYEQSFEDVWNSDKARDFRRSILDNSYKYCNRNICGYNGDLNSSEFKEIADYPKYIKFSNDRACNYKCITCRDDIILSDKEYTDFLDSNIETIFIPMLKNAEEVCFCGSGETFVSKHYRKLIKVICQTYPDIKFNLHTNGLLCNMQNCKDLGILEKLLNVEVSIHAINENTYKTITRNGDFKTVMENVKWLSSIKKEGFLKNLQLSFVVHSLNYKEMPGFVKIAENLGAKASFWEFRDWGSQFSMKYDDMAIFEQNHPDHDKFLNVISNDIFKSPNCQFNPLLRKLSEQ